MTSATSDAPQPSPAATIRLVHPDGRASRFRMMTPSQPGHWPVVLFSHGANSSSASYDRLWTVWSAHGFAVIGPDHIDTGPPASQAKPPAEGLYATRIADMLLPLRQREAFDRIAAAGKGTLDWSALAVAGHSFGAVIAQTLSGARVIDPAAGSAVALVRPAVRACVALSPPGPLAGFVPPDAWTGVRAPSLLQTGDADILPGFVDDWHARLTGFVGAADRWTVIGHDVDHYFGGLICRLRADAGAQSAALDETAKLSAAFLAAYLRRDLGARRALERRAALRDDGVTIFADASRRAATPAGRSGAMALVAGGMLACACERPVARRQLLCAAVALPLLAAAVTPPLRAGT